MFPDEIDLPTSICLRVTRRCNAACTFCQAPNTSRETLTTEEISSIGVFLEKNEIRSVKLSGGEPTVRNDLDKIIRIFGDRDIKSTVITNGISVEDSVFRELDAANGELKFSIHRPDSGNDIVFRVHSFADVQSNMAKARSIPVPFSINTVVTPATMALMPSMVRFGIQEGARKISFIPVVPRGRARAKSIFEFNAAELEEVRAQVDRLADVFRESIEVRCIDIRTHDYWVIENNGSLWVERARDADDFLVYTKNELIGRVGSRC